MEVSAGRAIVDVLKAEGVKAVFGIPGGHTLGIYDALYDTPEVRHILVRHEQVAANMAAGYAQLTGEPGVCCVTAGPGATNLVSGIAEAFVGALPIVILAGRGATTTTHRGASQEIAQEQIFRPITKWSVRIDRADLIVGALRQAFTIARSGKPGPVLIDIPRDVLAQQVSFDGYQPVGKPLPPRGNPAQIAAAAAALRRAARPLIIAGGGAIAADAPAEVRALAEALQAPVLTTLSGRGSLPDDHPLAAGGIGHHRTWLTKRLLPEADVVLGLGCRFEEQETNWRDGYVPDPRACYIQVDIDPAEIGRSVVPKLAVVGDVRLVLRDLLDALKPRRAGTPRSRLEELARDKAKLEDEVAGMVGSGQRPIHPMRVIGTVRDVFPRDATVAIDVGVLAQGMGGAFPYFKVYRAALLHRAVELLRHGLCVFGAAGRQARLPGPAGGRLRRRRLVPDDHERAADRRGAQAAGDLVRPQRRRARLDPGRSACRLRQPHHRDHVRDAAGFRPHRRGLPVPWRAGRRSGRGRPALERARDANARGVPAVIDFIVARERLAGSVEFFTRR